MKKIVLVSGGFDPCHSGHIAYFKEARKLGDLLVVGLNSDSWLTRKKGRPFMPFEERAAILEELTSVDSVICFDDSDNSACDAIKRVQEMYPDAEIQFANGGDRTYTNTPEMDKYGKCNRVRFHWGVGGEDKRNSSSWILKDWKTAKTERPWGWYRVLDERPGYKVKELVVNPGASLSDQRHFLRSEKWLVVEGKISIDTEWLSNKNTITLSTYNSCYTIGKEVWHRAYNTTDKPCYIIEVQQGAECVEEDIERRD